MSGFLHYFFIICVICEVLQLHSDNKNNNLNLNHNENNTAVKKANNKNLPLGAYFVIWARPPAAWGLLHRGP